MHVPTCAHLVWSAIQAARLGGFSPIITTSSLKHTEYLKTLGATHVLDRSLSSSVLLAEIAEIAAGTPIKYAFDTIGGEDTQRLAHDALVSGGSFVTVAPVPNLLKIQITEGRRVVHASGSFRLPTTRELGLEVYRRMTTWLQDGTIVVCLLFLYSLPHEKLMREQSRTG